MQGGSGGGLADMLGGLLGRGGGGGLGGMLGGGSPMGSPMGGAPMGGNPMGGGGLGGLLGGVLGGTGGGGGLGGMLGGLNPPMGGAIGSAAAGGLLGSLLGGGRRGGGGLLRMGGMAVLGMLAHRAYQQYQQSRSAPQAAPMGGTTGYARPAALSAPPAEEFARFDAPAADGHAFGLVLIRAMAAAARADGHMDEAERNRIFDEVERLGLGPAEKGFVVSAMEGPIDPAAIAAGASTDAQKAELYMASRLVAEPDTAAERAYLDALAQRLGLDPALRASLDQQAAEAGQVAAQMA